MIQGTATLVVDFGNSSTKAKVLFGKGSNGKFRYKQFEVPNVFAPVSDDYVVSDDYNTQTSTILRVDTELNGHVIRGDFCNGEVQQKEKPLSTIKPSASAKKYNLDSTVLSYRLALLFACKAIMQMHKVKDFSQLDITWNIVTLLPPGDMDTGKAPMTELVRSIDKIEAVYPKMSLPVKINKVLILPEGMCAYTGVVYDSGQLIRGDYKYLMKESVLVIDIGAGTTDICFIKENKLVQNSKYTVNQGGNNVYQLVRRQLMLKGYSLDESVVRQGVITGEVKDGSKPISVVDMVNTAKSEIAQKIVSEIQNYLELTDIQARSIGYVLVCGGGSMQDSNIKEIQPLSKRIIESFKQLSPNTSDIVIPTHMVLKDNEEDGEVTRSEEPISPRELNLIGASILAETL